MDALDVATMDGGRTRLDAQAMDALRNRFIGELITATDAEYDAARTIWNALIDKRRWRRGEEGYGQIFVTLRTPTSLFLPRQLPRDSSS